MAVAKPLLLAILMALLLLAPTVLRGMALICRYERRPRAPRPLSDQELPVYTVLVPLYREVSVLVQLIEALLALRYPVHKLDIKLVIEKSDFEMRAAIARLTLPPHFTVVEVPPAHPVTKPKALNYALSLARGSLVTVYDAEDLPHPGQLRLAAATFATCEPRVACLQAVLAFYNPAENWLTRQFAIEYAALFDVQMPMLSALGWPFPLGGTSNHFRVDELRYVGGWDPFNVTEDADLGFRLARFGYEARAVASVTYEEANVALANWIAQRTRWLKGFLQTWLVHMRNPVRTWRELGHAGFFVLQATTLGPVASALVHPFFVLWLIWGWQPAHSRPPSRPSPRRCSSSRRLWCSWPATASQCWPVPKGLSTEVSRDSAGLSFQCRSTGC